MSALPELAHAKQELSQRQEKLRALEHSLLTERGELNERQQQEVAQPLH
ncbi:hypothetical protein ACIGXF_36495 [Streptomyces sp. NPDC053086]